MQTINRTALLVRNKQPYFDWAASIDGEAADHLELLKGETSVYLVASAPDGGVVVTDYAPQIFEEELQAWCRDSDAWPAERDYPTFMRWFDVQIQPLIFDLEDEAVTIERP